MFDKGNIFQALLLHHLNSNGNINNGIHSILFRIQDLGSRTLHPGCNVLDPGSRIGSTSDPDPGSRVQDVGSRVHDTGARIVDPGPFIHFLDPMAWVQGPEFKQFIKLLIFLVTFGRGTRE